MALSGHLWTVGPTLAHRLRPARAPAARPWSTTLHDPVVGELGLRGRYRELPDARACLLVVHGLGGTTETFYCVRAAIEAEALGLSCLRLSLRGADRQGDDFYHAGLTADLDAAIASPELARYERIYVLGYSLGGHVTLRYGLSPGDPRVGAVAAVCPPLDLDRGAVAIDDPRALVYRRHVLSGLKDIYRAVSERRREVPTPLADVLAADTLRDWDRLTVVPRFGFDSVEAYYDSQSAGPRLDRLQRPALIVQSEHDPMVPPWTYRDHLARELPQVTRVQLPVGGHVAFPASVQGVDGRVGRVERWVIEWLLAR